MMDDIKIKKSYENHGVNMNPFQVIWLKGENTQ